jgi:HlyD family secretion protein
MEKYKAIPNLAVLKLFCLSLVTVLLFDGCQKDNRQTYQGYTEGEFVNISSSQSGKLDKLFIKRGAHVTKGTSLFALECESELIALHQASSELAVAQATLGDYKKGSRPQELSVIEAQLSQARANAENAVLHLNRNTPLYHANALSKAEFDDSVALAKNTGAKVEELRDSLRVAKLAKRIDQITAQEARIKQLRSAVEQAQWKLDEKSLKSRGNALVFDTLYREGEWVNAGGIVVRLLPPENIKIRFFVPQRIAEQLSIGQNVIIGSRADGKKLPAHVTYISTEAEYTPPIIYSNDTKEKLIYMIEAYPDINDAPLFHPGQPVEISLER